MLNLLLAPRLAAERERAVAETAAREMAVAQTPKTNTPPPVTVVKPTPAPAHTAEAQDTRAARSDQPRPTEAAPDVLFGLESEKVTAMNAAVALHRVAQEMRLDHRRRLLLRGHADKLGPPKFNVMLSRRRADSVRHFLIAHGAPADRIDIEAVGDAEPADTGDGFMAWAKNRRVQVLWR
ncbi:MAG: OmpA family protein [Minicystis sp.]